MKKFIVASLIGIMATSAGVATSPIIATGLTELIAEELIVDENQSVQIKLVYHHDMNMVPSHNICLVNSSYLMGSNGGSDYGGGYYGGDYGSDRDHNCYIVRVLW